MADKRIVRVRESVTSPHEEHRLSERTLENVCEGCGNVDIRVNENIDKDLRLVVVVKPTWAPFFMCIECLEDEITGHDNESEMTIHF